ncbi:MAG: transcriptional regulator [Gallionellales bacterium 35-53-114]|jgi:DNA-binding NtrC family response regulator|nr:MAG: transcriptional regulator [Gallionellales bacterium 35-53-114]OYZ64924.1 MAG: transcriptional regulator [Gallionellales bacterium 24-53-125]OZB07539.1 MAG: transcriptional regulator [Gallionellales bacterium 39-52-133]HQS58788.1 sigma-54 dependent transcriptional regulator [Gallionellaceae bacterium]HQS75128.1 sigma-54 dependent transcriptional regulator [Gallionellaceae bacterium]
MNKLSQPRICLVEDDEIMGESLCDRFELEGFQIDWHRKGMDGLLALRKQHYDLVISDIHLPDISGDEIFIQLLDEKLALPPYLFITGYGSIDRAVRLLKLGVADYISKPFDLDLLVEKVHQLCPVQADAHGNGNHISDTLGISPIMRSIENSIPRLAKLASTILITGDSGVGKEYVAQLVHKHASKDSGAPFVAVNCGAITETLLESELFGHEKGAFTGAARSRKGVFEQAHKGTLFLDEIGEMSLTMQVKLLRAIQERCIVRVGGETTIPVDVHLICATNRDLKNMVEASTFREDLYYRIHVIRLRIPQLRERKEDILWFAQLFLKQCAQLSGENHVISPSAERVLLDYEWPGNLRELKHSVERACILSHGPMLLEHDFFDDMSLPLPDYGAMEEAGTADGSLTSYLRECEHKFILQSLRHHLWHFGNTASALGISRKNLWEKMKKLDIHADKSIED